MNRVLLTPITVSEPALGDVSQPRPSSGASSCPMFVISYSMKNDSHQAKHESFGILKGSMVKPANKQLAKMLRHGIARGKKLLRTRRFWYSTGGAIMAIILLQLLLPYDKAFIGATLDGQAVGLKTKQDLIAVSTGYYKRATVTTAQPASKTLFKETGIVIDKEASATQVINYPVWQRFIPLSSLYRLINNQYYSSVSYSAISVSQWAKTISAACYVAPQDATIAVTGEGTLAVIPSKKGVQCDEKTLIASLKATPLSPQLSVDTKQKELLPKRTDQQVSAQLDKIQAVVDQGISVRVLGTTTKANPQDIISWLAFTDGPQGQLVLDINPDTMQPFIAEVQQPVYIAPGTTIITMVDGKEISRIDGAAGRGIDSAALVASLRTQLQTLKISPIDASVVAIAPKQDVRRSYTNSAAGLQALLNDLAAEKGNMAIAVTELSGQGRVLSANGTKQYHPASTYKLVVAYSVIKSIEAGQLKWDDLVDDQTVDQCLTKMIVNSDNACAESFAEKLTWKAIQANARAIGMVGTNLNAAEPVSTVNDQVALLKKLQNNELMKPENTTKLLDLMKRQVYRSGIPAGVAAQVADKVGFLSGLLHDSAIVYAPSGIYVISVYSSGGTWGNISDVARRINALIAN